jgi:uracil-DNA glycosylase
MANNTAYDELVESRIRCRLCTGLVNPSVAVGGQFDSTHIGPWSRWQGNLRARLMVVGQDWGDVRCLVKNRGVEPPSNVTNTALVRLLESIGVEISPPGSEHGQDVAFFTNAVLCLKTEGGLQGKVEDIWFQNCSEFLRGQVEIVRPEVVVGLGARAYAALLSAFGFVPPASPYKRVVESKTPVVLPTGSSLFGVYHCGAQGQNRNRPMAQQLVDWERIHRALQGAG